MVAMGISYEKELQNAGAIFTLSEICLNHLWLFCVHVLHKNEHNLVWL